jgi:general secretion pathway protein D
MARHSWRRWLPPLLLIAALSGCEAMRYNSDGMRMIGEGQTLAGLESLRHAVDLDPRNPRYRMDYLTQRQLLTQRMNDRADEARMAGRADEAQRLYRDVQAIDRDNERARRGLQQIEDARRADGILDQAAKALKDNQLDTANELVKRVLKEFPQQPRARALQRDVTDRLEAERQAKEKQAALQAVFKRPVTLQFRDANLRMVFEALSRTSNLNIILDREVKNDLRTTIYVKDATVEDTVDLILLQNQLEKKVLNNNTIFVYPATTAKQKEYAELKVRSFQLSNVEAQYMANIIKTMLKTKDVVTDQRTNTLIMRDTADAIAVAEKLVAAQDIPEPEVMLEVEVLEVTTGRNSNIGISWPDQITFSVPADGPTTTTTGGTGTVTTSGTYTLGGLRAVRRDQLLINQLSIGLNLQLQDSDARVLASPRIRARQKEKAKILIGDKVPVITNTVTPVTSGGSVVTGSVQYLDVGIKLEVEPQVYADDDVGIKINLEVSNIAKTIQGPQGSLAYQIGTRNAQTALRLHDGETQVLGGLINDQDRSSAQKVPGLGQLPVLGRLFSNHSDDGSKSEIILSITPRIIRPQASADAYVRDVWSGTESSVREKPLRLEPIGTVRASTDSAAPARTVPGAVPSTAPAPAPQSSGNAPPPNFVPQQQAPAPLNTTPPLTRYPGRVIAPIPTPAVTPTLPTLPGAPQPTPPAAQPPAEPASAPPND